MKHFRKGEDGLLVSMRHMMVFVKGRTPPTHTHMVAWQRSKADRLSVRLNTRLRSSLELVKRDYHTFEPRVFISPV